MGAPVRLRHPRAGIATIVQRRTVEATAPASGVGRHNIPRRRFVFCAQHRPPTPTRFRRARLRSGGHTQRPTASRSATIVGTASRRRRSSTRGRVAHRRGTCEPALFSPSWVAGGEPMRGGGGGGREGGGARGEAHESGHSGPDLATSACEHGRIYIYMCASMRCGS